MVVLLILLSCVILTTAEHTGAYSSPQYAKKMYPKYNYDNDISLPREKPPIPFKEGEESAARYDSGYNDTAQYGRSSLLEAAGNFMSGTGGQVVTSLARDFISRSAGTSQVGFDCVSQVRITLLLNLHACMSNAKNF